MEAVRAAAESPTAGGRKPYGRRPPSRGTEESADLAEKKVSVVFFSFKTVLCKGWYWLVISTQLQEEL